MDASRKMPFFRLLSALLFCFHFFAQAQVDVPVFGNITPLDGFYKALEGQELPYVSTNPRFARVALLTRCTDGNMPIIWETDPIPEEYSGEFACFRWIAAHSSGTSKADRHFDLYINDEYILTFITRLKQKPDHWHFKGKNDVELVFEKLTEDWVNDLHGRMYLKVPLAIYGKGNPLKIRICGQKENSPDWFMTFKYRFVEKIDIEQFPLLIRKNDREMQSIFLRIDHVDPVCPMAVYLDGHPAGNFTLKYGYNLVELPVEKVTEARLAAITIRIGNTPGKDTAVLLKPVAYREVYLIPHSHTDIGYSHHQEEVIRIHNRNIETALRTIERTRAYPPEARFRWNVEVAWAAENFMKMASPQMKNSFLAAIRDGNIAVGAIFANISTGLCKEEELMHLTDYAHRLEKITGKRNTAAMMSDIPGFTWNIVPALARNGVRYFSSGPNYMESIPDGGDRVGHSNKAWGDRPFYWIGPDGRDTILFWMTGKGYSSWHGFKAGDLDTRGAEMVGRYMKELEEKNYPYQMVQWRYTIQGDNGPVDTTMSDFVRNWNEHYSSPKLILSTIDALFRDFEGRYAGLLPRYAGDLSPYWEDGALSTTYETAMNRNTSEKLEQLGKLKAMVCPDKDLEEVFYNAWREVLLFSEHTWGAHNSISDPDSPFVTSQWEYKRQFALRGAEMAARIEKAILSGIYDRRSDWIRVYNTHDFPFRGVVYVNPPDGPQVTAVLNPDGESLPSQSLADGRLAFISRTIARNAHEDYRLVRNKTQGIPLPAFQYEGNKVSGNGMELCIDPENGSITSLIALGTEEWVSPSGRQGLNSFYYVGGLDPGAAVNNETVSIDVTENGPVMLSLRISSAAPGCKSLLREITFIKDEPLVRLTNVPDIKASRDKGSIHFGFPFSIKDGLLNYDLGYGFANPLRTQLDGANKDYVCAMRWADLSNDYRGISLLLAEMPMIEPGGMADERKINNGYRSWRKEALLNGTLYSYVANNYWHTNFKADQQGKVTLRYALYPHGLFDADEIRREALKFNQALIAVPVRIK